MSEQLDVEESRRVSTQIMTLSTQLIESIEKQSTLEKELNQVNKTVESQTAAFEEHESLSRRLQELEKSVAKKDEALENIREELRREKKSRAAADSNVDKLNREVEDLTASLFDEANNMVADARKGTHAAELRSSKLLEQLHERDALLETLNLQLKHLKKVIQSLDDDSTASENVKALANASDSASLTASVSKTFSPGLGRHLDLPLGPIFSPNITSIRYDLGLYGEFLKFLAVLPLCQEIKETASESKLLRRLVNDEIQPVLKLENAGGLGWIAKRTLVNLMMEGLVVVEPISGLNETHQYGYGSPVLNRQGQLDIKGNNSKETRITSTSTKNLHLFNYPSDSPPVAVREKCAICGESRDDFVEHARLHLLKTQTRADDGTLSVTNTFPLCKYCVLKIRQTCEIFAFLRSLKLGAWKLEKISLTCLAKADSKEGFEASSAGNSEDSLKNSKEIKKENKNSHRKSFISTMNVLNKTTTVTPEVPVSRSGAPTTNIQRAWVQLCKLRSMLHWTHIGIWNAEDSISFKIGPLTNDEGEDVLVKSSTNQSKSSSSAHASIAKEILAPQTPVLTKVPAGEDNTDADTFDFETGARAAAATAENVSEEQEAIEEKKVLAATDYIPSLHTDDEKNTDPKPDDKSRTEAESTSQDLMNDLDKLGEQLKMESGEQEDAQESTSGAQEPNGKGFEAAKATSWSIESNLNVNGSDKLPVKNSTRSHNKNRSIKSFLHSDTESASNTDDQFDDAQEDQ